MDTSHSVAPATKDNDDPTLWKVDDALWKLIGPVLRSNKVRKKPGRPRRDDREIFNGLIWLARTGSQWAALPREFGPKSTVHERFTEWVTDGKLKRVWEILLREYDAEIGSGTLWVWTWLAADGCLVKAPFGKKGGPARVSPLAPIPLTGGTPRGYQAPNGIS